MTWAAPPGPIDADQVPRGQSHTARIVAFGSIAIGVAIFLIASAKLNELSPPSQSAMENHWVEYRERESKLSLWIWAGIGVTVFGVAYYVVAVPTAKLRESLEYLQPLDGRTMNEISSVLGEPRETEHAEDGRVTRGTWKSPRFRFTLGFRNDVCTGLIHKRSD